jgi:ADP-ribosylglycohydrolase/DNA-binding transcriptional MerR regulator
MDEESEAHTTYSIEDLSRQAGLPVRTVRYYVAEGLIPGPGARGRGARYGVEHLERLRVIRKWTSQQVPLSQIRQRLEGKSCQELRHLVSPPRVSQEQPMAPNPSPAKEIWTRHTLRPGLEIAVRSDLEGQHAELLQRIFDLLQAPQPRRPERTAEGAAPMIGRFVPAASHWHDELPSRPDGLPDLARGCLVWGAVGAALGRPVVGLDPATIRARYGPGGLDTYEPWARQRPGSRGSVSGDIQIMREVALTLLDGQGRFDPETFARRLVALLPDNRGLGQACKTAGEALARGTPWWKAGLECHSAGNGAALRAAPLGLRWCLSSRLLLHREAVVSALVTHTHPMGVAGAVVMAQAVAWLLRRRLSGATDVQGLLPFLAESIQGMETEGLPQRRPGAPPLTLLERLRQMPDLLALQPEEAMLVTWNGALTLESVPAALYFFLKFLDSPGRAVHGAVNAGFDADSVACMTGQLAGAWWGAHHLETTLKGWWEGLEGRDGLISLADRLTTLATAPPPPPC